MSSPPTTTRCRSPDTNRLFGVAGIAAARICEGALLFLIAGGAIYLVPWIHGLVIDHGADADLVPVNTADNWLHPGLGVGMIALGLLVARGAPLPKPHAARSRGTRVSSEAPLSGAHPPTRLDSGL
ncbi:DUF4383 domain-containing protein [Amycolatopsis sp. NPDC058340]|uniref:DUF4383 domain-containing protein n=1 Tax=Amycolatopsis sp. NPDC058340 TaxID=3346453 RepID=UPI0036645532